MKKIHKILIFCTGIFVLVLAGSAIALRVAFPPEKVKKMALEEISKRLGREVSLGEVTVNIFSGVGLSEFRLSEKPNFAAGTFVEAKSFSVHFSLLALLQKKVEITSVKLDSPKIQIRRYTDGKTYNFSDLVQTSTVAPQDVAATPSQETPSPVEVAVTKAKIADGEVRFIDDSPQNVTAAVRAFNLSVQGSSVKKPIKISLSSEMEARVKGDPLKGEISFSGVVSALDQKIKVDKFSWKTDGFLALSIQGNYENFMHPKVDANLEISEISTSRLRQLLPPENVPPILNVLQLDGKPNLKLHLKGNFNLAQFQKSKTQEGKFSIDLKTDFKDSDLRFEPYLSKPSGEILIFDFAGDWNAGPSLKESVEFSRLALQLKSSSLESKGRVSAFTTKAPDFDVDLQLKNVSLDEFAGRLQARLPQGVILGGSMSANAHLAGNPSDLNVKLNLDTAQTKIHFADRFRKEASVPLALDIEGNFKSGKSVDVSQMILRFKNGSLESSARISELSSLAPRISARLKAKEFLIEDITGLIPDGLPKNVSLTGKISLDSEVEGSPSGALSMKLSLDASQTQIELSDSFKKDSATPLTLGLKGTLSGKEDLEISGFTQIFQKSEIIIQGKIQKIGSPAAFMDLKLRSKNLQWDSIIASKFLPKDCVFKGQGNIRADFTGSKEKFKASAEIDLKDSEIALGPESSRSFKKRADIPLNIKLKGSRNSPDDFDMESFALVLGKTNLSGQLRLLKTQGAKRTFHSKLVTDPVSLSEISNYLPALSSFQAEGTVQTDFSLSGNIPFETAPKGSGWLTLKNIGADLNGLNLKAVNGRLTFSESGYELSEFSGKISDTPFDLKVSLKNPSSPLINIEANLPRVDLSMFQSSADSPQKKEKPAETGKETPSPAKMDSSMTLPPAKLTGKLKIKELAHPNFEVGNISLEWNLSDVTPKLDKISGTAKLRTFGGEVKNIGTVEKILKIINPSLSILDFKDIGGDFAFKEGTMQIKDLWIESEKLSIGSEGNISLAQKNCNVNILARYSGAALAASVPVSVTGPFASLKIEKKNVSILSQTLQEKVFRVRQKSADEIAEEKAQKVEKIIEKKEEIKLKEEQKKEVAEEKKIAKESMKSEKEELEKEKEEERLEKIREKEELRKQKEEERLERLREKEEEKRRKQEEKEEE